MKKKENSTLEDYLAALRYLDAKIEFLTNMEREIQRKRQKIEIARKIMEGRLDEYFENEFDSQKPTSRLSV